MFWVVKVKLFLAHREAIVTITYAVVGKENEKSFADHTEAQQWQDEFIAVRPLTATGSSLPTRILESWDPKLETTDTLKKKWFVFYGSPAELVGRVAEDIQRPPEVGRNA